ncbi:MAG: mannose-1-phosphate guanylyltransferase, partial [Chlorobi bacterium]|nr:mannose-1-phosphate guanylyltransferase [Chlorobiota bacterium]
GYGYIQYDADAKDTPAPEFKAYPVKTFAEKPNQETAMRFLESNDFVWNSGIFVWKAAVIREVIRDLLPELYEELQSIQEVVGTDDFDKTIRKAYAGIPSISIDYGVMEKAENTYVIRGDFGWSDLGSWDEVCVLSPKDEKGNTLTDNTIALDSRNCHVETYDDRLVAIIGMEDCIVIDSEKAILICRIGKSQRVKEVVDYLRRKRRNEYL